MKLAKRELQIISQKTGVGEPGILRLIGSIKLDAPDVDEEEAAVPFDIGLQLSTAPIGNTTARSELVERIASAIKEYQRHCPFLVAWVSRGDFKPAKPPSELTKGMLVHATRTSGRLRAQLLQQEQLH